MLCIIGCLFWKVVVQKTCLKFFSLTSKVEIYTNTLWEMRVCFTLFFKISRGSKHTYRFSGWEEERRRERAVTCNRMRDKNVGKKYILFDIPSKLSSLVYVRKKDQYWERNLHNINSLANALQKVTDEGVGCRVWMFLIWSCNFRWEAGS